MRINTNVAALNSYNQLSNTNDNLSKSLERLSSGKRINSASDDAAGLAISEKMNSQTKGLAKAQRNAQDGISMIQTAEGALKESHSILQRMRELSVQAANDTNTDDDRAEIQKEVEQLTSELDRISTDTEFNTQKLLNGDQARASIIGEETNIKGAELNEKADLETGEYEVKAENTTEDVGDFASGGTNITSGDITASSDEALGEYEIETSNTSGDNGDITITGPDGYSESFDDIGIDSSGETIHFGENGNLELDTSSITSGDDDTASFTNQVTSEITVNDPDGDAIDGASGASVTIDGSSDTVEVGSGTNTIDLEVDAELSNGTDELKIGDGSTLHIGANEGQSTVAEMNNMSSAALNVDDVDLTSQESADEAISTIDDAIGKVSAERSKLGAVQNRLEHTINNLNTSEENLTAAESRIKDVDMAKEMMNMSKQQILSQAGNAMMAQANQLPQGVLQLLG